MDAGISVSDSEPGSTVERPSRLTALLGRHLGSRWLYLGSMLLVAAACISDTWVVARSPEPTGGYKIKERETALGCFSLRVRTAWHHMEPTNEVLSYVARASASDLIDDRYSVIAARRARLLGMLLSWVLAASLLLHALALQLASRSVEPGKDLLHRARRGAHIMLSCALLIALCLATPEFVLQIDEAQAGWYAHRGVFDTTTEWGRSTWLLLAAVLLRRPGR